MKLCVFQDDYSQYGIQGFSKQLRQKGGCLAFQLTIPKSPTAAEIREMADQLQGSSARVVVVFATEGQLLELFLEVGTLNVRTGEGWSIFSNPVRTCTCINRLIEFPNTCHVFLFVF